MKDAFKQLKSVSYAHFFYDRKGNKRRRIKAVNDPFNLLTIKRTINRKKERQYIWPTVTEKVKRTDLKPFVVAPINADN